MPNSLWCQFIPDVLVVTSKLIQINNALNPERLERGKYYFDTDDQKTDLLYM